VRHSRTKHLASAGKAAIRTKGSLDLGVGDGTMNIQGGNGEHAIAADEYIVISIDYDGPDGSRTDSAMTIRGGSGGAAIYTDSYVEIYSHGMLFAEGGSLAHAVLARDSVAATGPGSAGESIFVSGAVNYPAVSSGNLFVSPNHKFYGGENAGAAVRCVPDMAYSYIRIQPKSVIVTLDANGGSIENQTTYQFDARQNADNSVTVQIENIPERDGYRFLSWNSRPDGSGTTYVSGETYSFEEATDAMKLYAQWEELEYVAESVDGKVQIMLRDAVEEGAQVILAAYDPYGKMLTTARGTMSTDHTKVWLFPVKEIPENAEWKLLYADSNYRPVKESLEIVFSEN